MYSHTQSTLNVIVGFVVLVLVFLVAMLGDETTTAGAFGLGAFLVVVGLLLANFSRLSVSIEGDTIHLRFGRGWPHKEIALADVATADIVRNKWWFGFGIRYTPHGWLYNVWGLDAVQLDFTSGKSFRIGTDEPDELMAAIKASLPSR